MERIKVNILINDVGGRYTITVEDSKTDEIVAKVRYASTYQRAKIIANQLEQWCEANDLKVISMDD